MTSKETPQQAALDDAQREQVSSDTGNTPDAVVLSDKDLDKLSGGGSLAGGTGPKGPVGGPGG